MERGNNCRPSGHAEESGTIGSDEIATSRGIFHLVCCFPWRSGVRDRNAVRRDLGLPQITQAAAGDPTMDEKMQILRSAVEKLDDQAQALLIEVLFSLSAVQISGTECIWRGRRQSPFKAMTVSRKQWLAIRKVRSLPGPEHGCAR